MSPSAMHRQPIRAIVARFSSGPSLRVMEKVFNEYPFDFCAIISAGDAPDSFSSLPPEAQERFVSAKIRSCEYEGVDWNALAPLDANIIEGMRDTEAVFMDTVARLEWKRSIPYAVRKRWYLQHLRFWNDYLTRRNINLFLSAWIPHEVPDVLLYRLCRLRGIPTLFFHTTLVQDVSFGAYTWEDPAPHLKESYEKLLQKYASATKPEDIPLEPIFEKRYQSLIIEKAEQPGVEGVRRKTEWDRIKDLFWKKPMTFARHGFQYLTPRGVRHIQGLLERRRVVRERNAFYDSHAVDPDMTRPFVYLALHFQPEASTTPMAGCFTDQILVARMLNACLPDDVLIYAKEHPRESSWAKRSREDYEELVGLKKVRLVARKVDTFALREKCAAVVTCSGSAGFEALFRNKPVMLFGSRFYQYARGVFRIQSIDDCRNAVKEIFLKKAAPSPVDTRIFMKAMEESGIRALLHPLHLQITNLAPEQHVENNAKAILSELAILQSDIERVP